MNRRSFLQQTAWMGAGTLAAGALVGCAAERPETSAPERTPASERDTTERIASGRPPDQVLQQIGVQLYTVRGLMESNVEETLQQVADVGYKTVETAGIYDHSPADFRALLDRYELRSPSGHYPLEALEAETQRIIDTAGALGQQFVVCPYLAEAQRQSLDDYRALADTLNRLGERFAEAGLQLAYHNHDFEFETFGADAPAYDVLLERTEPEQVAMELDLYWIYKAGFDPASYFERYPGRFALAHVKDSTAPPEKEMVSVGEGVLDFPSLFAQGEQAGLQYAFVEHDQPDDALASIRTSYDYLSALEL